jgi:Holliday junction resolvase-like predicted endonuclease
MLTRNGYEILTDVKNASQNGLDVVARAPDGRIVFFEVKTTRGLNGNSPGNLSGLQQDSQSYIYDVMDEASNGFIRRQQVSQEIQDFARLYMKNHARNGVPPNIPVNAIGVNLAREEILVSRW